jgi:hypothetical protein
MIHPLKKTTKETELTHPFLYHAFAFVSVRFYLCIGPRETLEDGIDAHQGNQKFIGRQGGKN